jgi:hypothetical protein
MMVYAACTMVLVVLANEARRDHTVRHALLFGAVIGWTWPLGEGLVVRTAGWWGNYLAAGPMIWDTPVYCVLIGWIGGAYCYFIGARMVDWGWGNKAWAFVSGISAFAIGALGENLYVWARIWEYDRAGRFLGDVPLFLPIAYGISYACLPLLARLPVLPQGLVFNAITLVISVTAGFAAGFFPR